MIFRYIDKLVVEISPEVAKFIRVWMAAGDYKKESGGILVGTLRDGPHITITDVTVPQQQDRSHPFRFIRSGAGHQELMDQLWKQSEYQKMYLGEWHTHREQHPSYSSIDACDWKRIAEKKQNSTWMLFFIIGQESFRLWTVDHGVIMELILNA